MTIPKPLKMGSSLTSALQAHTSFQRKGVFYKEESNGAEEDRDASRQQGIDPTRSTTLGPTSKSKFITGTPSASMGRKVETCLKDQSGQLPGKTIVFAMTKQHAHRIAEVFEEMYPQHVGVHSGHHVHDGTSA